jgi:dsRNA-specific ribonuclease
MRIRVVLPLASALALALAGVASAAPDRSGTLSAASTDFKWTGKIGVGLTALDTLHDSPLPCGSPGHDCDFTLLHVTTPGKVTFKSSSSAPNSPDLDLYLYLSDASGTKGKNKGKSAAPGLDPNEQIAFTADEPGYYLAEADYTVMIGGTYDGEAKLEPGVGIETANTPPTVKVSSPKKKVKSKSFKSISGAAADDSSVTKVEIAVLKGKGSKCQSLTSSGSFKKAKCAAPKFLAAKGTTKWSYKLKKKLKKGSYLVLVRVSDDGGASTTAKTAVKVS